MNHDTSSGCPAAGRLEPGSDIAGQQTHLLFTSAPPALIISAVLAVMMAMVQREVVEGPVVWAWLAASLAVTLVRMAVVALYLRASPIHASATRRWLMLSRVFTLLAGVVWGSAGVLLFPAHDQAHQLFLTFMLAGVSAGGMITHSADLISTIGFALAVLGPLIVRLFISGDTLSATMGVAGAIYLMFIYSSVRHLFQQVRDNLQLRLDALAREDVLQASEERYRLLLSHSPIGIMHYDPDLIITYCNNRFAEILQTTPEELHGLDMKQLRDPRVLPALGRVLDGEPAHYEGPYEATLSQASIEISMSCAPILDSRRHVLGGIAIVEDITERKQAQQAIFKLAFHDPLTHLPNRRMMLDRLKHALAARARDGREGALLFIDLDHFKTLNDTQGHGVGDQLLRQVAERLSHCVRDSDTIARLGGDEYVVILENLSSHPQEALVQIEVVGEKILTSLRDPFQLDGHTCHITASIGVMPFGPYPISVDELMKRADLAMYKAKAAGRDTFRFFDPEMQAAFTAQAELESDLRQGLRQGQFILYYQPQVDSQGLRLGGEALVRWQHPQRGLVLPTEFIPQVEESGLILPLGHWVLETACNQLVAWSRDPAAAHWSLAVNVSPRQFRQKDFADQVLAVLDASGADPARLKLEITESLLLDNLEETIAKMSRLKARGVSFSLDDFGTGYSSLSYLKHLPLDQMKIDRSFVMGIESDRHAAAICAAAIGLAHNLGYKVVAEGVETEGQRSFLSDHHHCDLLQGSLFGDPVPLEAFEASIRDPAGAVHSPPLEAP